MNLDLNTTLPLHEVFKQIESCLIERGFKIVARDVSRPWGGFFVIDESQAPEFARKFFPEVELETLNAGVKLSPKVLVVKPGKRLSWQYHHRRAELWKLIAGTAGVVRSQTDDEADAEAMHCGTIVRLARGERHRLVGTENYGVVAEIWQHTDALRPSDEADIVRLQDDFGRQRAKN